jgi:sigma-54-interacting transcriptional regulator
MNVTPRLHIVEPDVARLRDDLAHERRAIRTHRVNVLIQGTRWFVDVTLAALRQDIDLPEIVWPNMPANGDMKPATVIVENVGTLPPSALHSLADLIARSHTRVQVIATSSIALHKFVERGDFPAELYYRLNVISLTGESVELTGRAPG